MNRTLIVARSEFLSLVKTKAFLITLLMMPVLVLVSIAFQAYAAKHVDRDDHPFAVVDRTGVLYDAVAAAAREHNEASGAGDARTGPYFLPTRVDPAGRAPDDLHLDLSNEVRAKTLFAFVEIPASVLDLDATTDQAIDYYTETPSYDDLPTWLEKTLDRAIASQRFARAHVDQTLVAKLTRETPVTTLGLVQLGPNGTIAPARKVSAIETAVVPFAMMYLLFIALMSVAPQLLNAVIEEKMSKISEVLVASVRPFQLMMGKLLGVAAVAVLLALIYFVGGTYLAITSGHVELIQPALMGWFLVFLVCAALMFGSIFVAIGASCSDMKDAQSMMQPAMILLLVPMFIAPVVLRAPNAPIAVAVSLIPTATPFIMLLRLAMTPAPPLWQVLLSVVLTAGATTVLVWGAGRIFRVGLLMQGKGANFRQMIRWVRAG